ncbi:hypothetical protein C8R44DRAFT_888340 [Mycena epipterygia]|nr:hypothetical protein C8R44DRAFT_888340 [Mycena epipterygia]
MPNSRVFLHPGPQTIDTSLRSRLYSTSDALPTAIRVLTRCSSTNLQDLRYPCVESVLDSAGVQPHVHDIHVVFKHGRRITHFRAFFKRHVNLPANPHVDIRGELLIMRIASHNDNSVVNIRPGDRKLADYVASKFVLLSCA